RAHAGPPQDPAGVELRGGGRVGIAVPRQPAWSSYRCGVPAPRETHARGRFRTGPHDSQHRARRADRAAIRTSGVYGEGACGGIFLPAKALAYAVGRFTAVVDRAS